MCKTFNSTKRYSEVWIIHPEREYLNPTPSVCLYFSGFSRILLELLLHIQSFFKYPGYFSLPQILANVGI